MTPAEPLRALIGMPSSALSGGAERLFAALMARTSQMQLDAHVVLFSEGPLVEALRELEVRTTVVPVPRMKDPLLGMRTIASIRRMIAADSPEIVLSWMPRAHVYLSPAAALAGRGGRVVWWQHHIARGERLEAVATLMPTAAVVATSKAAAAAQEARRPRRHCEVVYPGIDPPERRPAAELEALRARLGLPEGRPVVGIAGRLVRWKGQHHFLAALERLGHATGLVVGGSPYGLEPEYAAELRAQVGRAGMADRVIFTGHVDDPLPHIELMDVLVSASDREPFGLTLLEAMGLGVPVVAVRSGGPAEIVEHEGSGILVDEAEPSALANGVRRLLADHELRVRLAEAGRRRFEERFTSERMAARAGEVLRGLARARR